MGCCAKCDAQAIAGATGMDTGEGSKFYVPAAQTIIIPEAQSFSFLLVAGLGVRSFPLKIQPNKPFWMHVGGENIPGVQSPHVTIAFVDPGPPLGALENDRVALLAYKASTTYRIVVPYEVVTMTALHFGTGDHTVVIWFDDNDKDTG